MKYWIFIDESGSINNKNYSYFSISLLIVKQNNFNKTKNDFKRTLKPLFKSIKNKSTELKAHYLKLNNKLSFLTKALNRCVYEYNNFICCYIKNENINKRWINDKGATYNFMVKAALQRAIDLNYIELDADLEILSDFFSASKKYYGSLEYYLKSEFMVAHQIFHSVVHNFIDSYKHWGIQLVDYLSFSNNRKIINKTFSNQKLHFRMIY